MLERIVENDDFAVLPAPCFFADSDACAIAAHDTKVNTQLLVRGAVVGYDVGAGGDCREHGVAVNPGYVTQYLQRLGAQSLHVVKVEVVELEPSVN